MFFEHLADEDDAALMRLFFDVGVFCFIPALNFFGMANTRAERSK